MQDIEMTDLDSLFDELEQDVQPRDPPQQAKEADPKVNPPSSKASSEFFPDLVDLTRSPPRQHAKGSPSPTISEIARLLGLDTTPPYNWSPPRVPQVNESVKVSYPEPGPHTSRPYPMEDKLFEAAVGEYDEEFLRDLNKETSRALDNGFLQQFGHEVQQQLPTSRLSTILQMNNPQRFPPGAPSPTFLLHGARGRYAPIPKDDNGAEELALTPSTDKMQAVDESSDLTDEEPSSPPRLPTDMPSSPPGSAIELPHIRSTLPTDVSKPWVRNHLVKGPSKRSENVRNYNPQEVYTPLPAIPRSWACFNYTKEGELDYKRFYSVPEIEQFLRQHPRHLTLWLQRNPADSARRYPHSTSNRCRFEDCVASYHCINQGQYRVAFDEQNWRNANHDPQHNAGYVHLYCLEKFLDFPLLCQDLDVRVDDRHLPNEPRGKNKMKMGTRYEVGTAEDFIQMCKNHDIPDDYPHYALPNRPYEGRLTHRLALTKLAHSKVFQMLARERGSGASTVAGHLGNLELETRARNKTRLAKNQKRYNDDTEDEIVVAPKATKSTRGATEDEIEVAPKATKRYRDDTEDVIEVAPKATKRTRGAAKASKASGSGAIEAPRASASRDAALRTTRQTREVTMPGRLPHSTWQRWQKY